MFRTPEIFMHLIRLLPSVADDDIELLRPAAHRQWHDNPYVFATSKAGSPYLVIRSGSMMFSVCRQRGSRNAAWSYFVRWPYGQWTSHLGIPQRRYTTKCPKDVIRAIKQVTPRR